MIGAVIAFGLIIVTLFIIVFRLQRELHIAQYELNREQGRHSITRADLHISRNAEEYYRAEVLSLRRTYTPVADAVDDLMHKLGEREWKNG